MADFSDLTPMSPQLDAMRRATAVHLSKDFPLVRTEAQANYTSEFYDRLMEWINGFHQSLDDEHEVGVRLVNFGQSVTFHLTDMGYWNPSLISFQGTTNEGNPVELIQHVSQISVLLVKLPRQNPGTPKKPIGFSTEGDPEA